MKTALLLCASHNDLGLLFALRKLGFRIIVSGNREGLPGQHLADEYVRGDYSDMNRMLAIAKDRQIDCIVSCCNDFGVYTSAYIAEKLGLPGYDSYDVTVLLHNKDRFKEFALKNGIQTPNSSSFNSFNEAVAYLSTASYPLIIKPTDCSAGNGISRVDNEDEALPAVTTAFGKSRRGRIVIEEYINGTQHGFCTFLRDQKVVAVCSNNEYSLLNPYRVEIDTFPASNHEQVQSMLIDQIERIARILKLKDGIFHLQYIMDGNRPMIIEVMRRILGNMYHVPGNFSTGVNWEYWQVRAQCGMSLRDFPAHVRQEGFFAYKAVLATRNGKIARLADDYGLMRYLHSTYWLLKPGDQITHYASEPVGFQFFMFPDEVTMRTVLIDGYSQNSVIME